MSRNRELIDFPLATFSNHIDRTQYRIANPILESGLEDDPGQSLGFGIGVAGLEARQYGVFIRQGAQTSLALVGLKSSGSLAQGSGKIVAIQIVEKRFGSQFRLDFET